MEESVYNNLFLVADATGRGVELFSPDVSYTARIDFQGGFLGFG